MDRNGADTPDQPAQCDMEIARGLLLAVATIAVAGFALADSRGAGISRMSGEIFTAPALLAIAGCQLRDAVFTPSHTRFFRALIPWVACGATATLVAALFGVGAYGDGRAGLARCAPALQLALLPAIYAAAARAMRGGKLLLPGVAVLAHIAGATFGFPSLSAFVFFLMGVGLAGRRTELSRLIARQPYLAAAAGPFAFALTLIACARVGPAGEGASVADIGPIALALGLSAGPAVLASASALTANAAGDAFRRLGRAAPAAATFWLPSQAALLRAADRGIAPSAASATLMAVASMLVIALAVDAIAEFRAGRRNSEIAAAR